ncbi:MAG: hypothetical protein J5725_02905 [Bacteroidales bacterium]|jgi:hypothetical protein|nr:hypothetical protein [Bacteroidales bacterium]
MSSNYREDYEPYIDAEGKADVDKLKTDMRTDLLREKNALVLFYNHIEDCKAELGITPIVAALLYALYDYNKTPDKSKYKMPDFKEYENAQAAAARMIFRSMATAARENEKKWLARKVVNRYNGSKPKRTQQTPQGYEQQARQNRYGGGIRDLPDCS